MTDTTSPSPIIAALAERLLQYGLAAEPLDATLIGLRDRDALLADLTAGHEVDLRAERAAIRSAAQDIDPSGLNAQDAVTRAVIIAQTEYADAQADAEALEYTVAAFPVAPSSILLAYLRMTVVTSPEQAYDYVARLSAIPGYLDQAEARLASGRAKGLLPVAHLVEMSIAQIDRFLATEPSPLVIPPPDHWDGSAAWHIALQGIIDDDVRPAFERHRDVLATQVLPTSRPTESAGLVHLPGGLDRYRGLVRVHTTTERTPEDLHATGHALVAAVHDEFRVLGAAVFGTADLTEIFARLHDDPDLRWHDEQEILDAAEIAVRRAEAAATKWFGRIPSAVCSLEAIPELEADGAPAAYYMQPALDGSRPGTYFSNVSQPTERTTFDLESVAFHEAVPGHHFQISLALELPDLPMIRRLSMFTAYVEGWGLYSERLADEMGLYSSDLQRIGMLSADVWRASRLVVDTGLHAFGWSRQRAIDYLLTNTPVAPIEVEAEIDRYIAYPGQALSYMTGRMEIERLRAEATSALGDRFDIRDFHDVVLGSGALPLAVLADVIEDWAAR